GEDGEGASSARDGEAQRVVGGRPRAARRARARLAAAGTDLRRRSSRAPAAARPRLHVVGARRGVIVARGAGGGIATVGAARVSRGGGRGGEVLLGDSPVDDHSSGRTQHAEVPSMSAWPGDPVLRYDPPKTVPRHRI